MKVHPSMEICLKHKLFEGLSKAGLETLLAKAKTVKMQPGEILFHAGDKGTSLFTLLLGELACITRDGKEVKVLQAGMPFISAESVSLAEC